MDNAWIMHGICQANYFYIKYLKTCMDVSDVCLAVLSYACVMQGISTEHAWLKMKLKIIWTH